MIGAKKKTCRQAAMCGKRLVQGKNLSDRDLVFEPWETLEWDE